MNAATSIDWTTVGQVWGPLGIFSVVFLVLVIAGAKWFKSTMDSTLADARRDRDAMRVINETQANKFLESLKIRDGIQEKGFDEILREIRDHGPRRK